MKQISISDANLTHTVEVCNYLFEIKKRDLERTKGEIIKYFDKTPNYTQNTINFLTQFGIVREKNDNLEIEKSFFKKLDGSKEKTLAVLKKCIIRYKPFIEYCSYKGPETLEASKFVKDVYDLKQSLEKINKIFSYWILFFKISQKNQPILVRTKLQELDVLFANDFSIQKFLRDQFKGNYKSVNQEVIDDLSESIKDYEKDPAKSINDAGRALEDFLRIDFADTIDLSKCNGIIEIANLLVGKKIITSKHHALICGLGAVRSMGDAHGADKIIKERWTIDDVASLSYVIFIVRIINSLVEFKVRNNLCL